VGTANVLDFAEECENLERIDYVSTCYVCGLRTGLVRESELDEGQDFKNHYEATKFWAELEVRRRTTRAPATIHRPSIVVGDSRTGATEKYDGPYYIIQLLLRLPRWLPPVYVGEGRAQANLVPVDFLVRAMAEIWANPLSRGLTVQLADPAPHTSREVLDALTKIIGLPKPLFTLPSRLVERALARPALRARLRVPAQTIAYFNHDVRFETENQLKLLAGTGLACPDFLSILPALVDYVRRNPEKPFLDGRAL
jgi:thioester reductase-like protein